MRRRCCITPPDRTSTSCRGAGARSPARFEAVPGRCLRTPTRCGARITQPVCPVQCTVIQRRIVLGEIRIAGVAENAFDEIQVADQAAGSEKTQFHGLPGLRSRRGTYQRPQQQRHPQPRFLRLIRGKREPQNIVGGRNARASKPANAWRGTAILSAGTGNPPSTT